MPAGTPIAGSPAGRRSGGFGAGPRTPPESPRNALALRSTTSTGSSTPLQSQLQSDHIVPWRLGNPLQATRPSPRWNHGAGTQQGQSDASSNAARLDRVENSASQAGRIPGQTRAHST